MRRTSARPNAVAIPALILLLLAASLFFILRLDGSGFFRKSFPIQSKGRASGSPTNAPLTKQGARGLKAVPTTADSVRDWNYYLQVSSWKKLTDAERVAQEYRDKGVTVKVQCVYLQTKRATVYRVRCGPFPSKSSASTFRETNASILPTDAFVDSIRAEQDPSGVKTVPTLTIPCRGYGIPVSSFDQSFSAKKRALEIAEQYAVPVFINVQQIHLTTWYRVFVGPFLTRSDAQRQAQFLSLFMKNDMQEFDLSKEK